MTTHASPRLTKLTLLVVVTLIFLAACYMFATGILHAINHWSKGARMAEAHQTSSSSSIESTSTKSTRNLTAVNSVVNDDDEHYFPSTSSWSVELIFGAITLAHAMFGIVAITKQQVNLLTTYGHILVISFVIKLAFLVGSVAIHSTTPKRNILTNVTVLAMITAIVELISVMCLCQFARLTKRGDAARHEIQSIHSYHIERRSRSRSQSRIRSLYNSSMVFTAIPDSATPMRGVSRACSLQDLSCDTESVNYFVPPPIYLKLDR